MLAAGIPDDGGVAATDRNAIGFQRALRAAGLVLPRDQAVIGFDHADSGARVTPRLSTVDAHYDRVGETAVVAAAVPDARRGRARRRVPGAVDARPARVLRLHGVRPVGARRRRPGAAAAAATRCCGPSPRPPSSARPASGGARRTGAAPRETWWHAVVEPIETAAERGSVPGAPTLARLADLTSAMQPHPEALEQLVTCLRGVETDVVEALSRPEHETAVRRAVTEVLLALTKGCTRAMLARSGQLERTIVDQYEVDMDLLRGDGASPRALGWLPRGVRGPRLPRAVARRGPGAGRPRDGDRRRARHVGHPVAPGRRAHDREPVPAGRPDARRDRRVERADVRRAR